MLLCEASSRMPTSVGIGHIAPERLSEFGVYGGTINYFIAGLSFNTVSIVSGRTREVPLKSLMFGDP